MDDCNLDMNMDDCFKDDVHNDIKDMLDMDQTLNNFDMNLGSELIKNEMKSDDSNSESEEGIENIYKNAHIEFLEPIVKIEEGEYNVEHLNSTANPLANGKKQKAKSNLCPLCGKVLKSNSFNLHMKRHKGVKKFPCTTCGKYFISNCTRKQHEIIHLNIRNFSCEQCGKKFSSRKLSNKHMNDVHLKLQRVQCNICSKYLSTKASYDNHMKTHTGQRDYECDVCHKKFIHKFSIICHLRMHTGDRPFGCNFCSSRFTHPKSLVEHERLHTGEAPYKCPFCGKGFAQQGNMKSHVKYNHKNSEIFK